MSEEPTCETCGVSVDNHMRYCSQLCKDLATIVPPARVEYLYPPERAPAVCPQCGSDHITNEGDEHPDLYDIVNECRCLRCHFVWTEHFTFQRWDEKD